MEIVIQFKTTRRKMHMCDRCVPSSVSDETVALHLPEAQAAVPRAALGRLPREHGPRPARARVHLVLHHVLQLLVVNLEQCSSRYTYLGPK